MRTSERLSDLINTLLWWPLYLVDKMRPGPLKFLTTIAVLPMAFPCILMAIPVALLTFFVEMWEEANR